MHDIGGMHGFGAVDVAATESQLEGWENRLQVVALMVGGGTNRAGIEMLEPATYLSSSYHERWLLNCERQLLARGALTAGDLDRWRDLFTADPTASPPATSDPDAVEGVDAVLAWKRPLPRAVSPRFAVDDHVRVRRLRPAHHHRCPRYVRGVVGAVERIAGEDQVPGRSHTEPVYTVRFDSVALWGERGELDEPPYEVLIDLWESYLEAP